MEETFEVNSQIIEIPLKRILDVLYPNFPIWNWQVIPLEIFKEAEKDNVPLQGDFYTERGNNMMKPKKNEQGRFDYDRSDLWHIGRVLYLKNHPEEIEQIELRGLQKNFSAPKGIVVDRNLQEKYGTQSDQNVDLLQVYDGSHRLIALELLDAKSIEVLYSGTKKMCEYLLGKLQESEMNFKNSNHSLFKKRKMSIESLRRLEINEK